MTFSVRAQWALAGLGQAGSSRSSEVAAESTSQVHDVAPHGDHEDDGDHDA